MHIAWIGKKTPFCGNVTYSREVTNGLLDRGHQVSFFHFTQEGQSSEPDKGKGSGGDWRAELDGRDVSLPCLYKSQIYTIPTPNATRVLTQALRELKPDLVHASLTISPIDFVLPEICAELQQPLVATFHPAFDRRRRNIASRTQHLAYQIYAPSLANYDRTIVFSETQREILIKLGVRGEQVAVIPNGVDVDKYAPGPSSLKQRLGLQRVFVYQGRVSPEKNLEALLKAWKQSQMGESCGLLILGDGPLVNSLKPFYNAQHGIHWLGYVAEDQQRIEILRGADVFILPSLIEGLSLSLLEAMACGLAPVATDVGADGEVLAGGAGILLDPTRVTAELQTLLPLLRDQREFTQLLGMKARQRVLERYTLSHNISQVEQLYRQLCQGSRQRLQA
ncbi:glycosyltransferase family 4 protein [Synechococcus sp. Nb3U1]|uniref:glycosyltransferase family 4 protein n=1 Tax=Synechococcus sp. Nb3U1 TaxID=1914529 RepID=UPI001F459ECD|nr:glycosyltransferase family 4 protein [Synechococcus sp. Nb3U1]MCF2969637.1 glycosyltransferase family 4 protein [Synechococcus sp. Nb3U1]